MQAIKLFGLLAVLTLFFACGDDDDNVITPTIENEFTINDTTFPLNGTAYVTNEFLSSDEEVYVIFLTGEGVSVDDGDLVGDGVTALLAVTAEAGGLPDGTYQPAQEGDFEEDGRRLGRFYLEAVESLENDDFSLEEDVTAGSVTISTVSGQRQIVIEGVEAGSDTYSGSFRGSLTSLD